MLFGKNFHSFVLLNCFFHEIDVLVTICHWKESV